MRQSTLREFEGTQDWVHSPVVAEGNVCRKEDSGLRAKETSDGFFTVDVVDGKKRKLT